MRYLAGLFGLALFGLVLLARSDEARGQDGDPRTRWVFDDTDESRFLKLTGMKGKANQWAEYRMRNKLERIFTEKSRTSTYIELYTATPRPTWVRIYNKSVQWRADTEKAWRKGSTGYWIE